VRQYGEMIVPTRRHLFCPINETKGSFFLTTGGAPYDCRWKAVTTEPFETMSVFIELPLLQRAFEEVFGDRAPRLRLRDVSAFTDPTLNSLMEQVKSELMRRDASPLLLGGSRYAKKACAFH
jgi:AraC family transcriptional regulator